MKTLMLALIGVAASAQTAPNWTQQNPENSPPPRYDHAMAYDSVHSQVVLFGGVGNDVMNDTWVWDGSNWTQKSPVMTPPARDAHAMVYDSAHRQVVLFGGYGSLGFMNDTWVWDGSNWTQKSPKTSPPARSEFAMAYDSAHGKVVLFGGSDNNGFLNDTWLWDGNNWNQESPKTSPDARISGTMAYVSAQGQAVLFGGVDQSGNVNNFGVLNDTWVWDGANWLHRSPLPTPIVRFSDAAAYDTVHNQVVLFGGSSTLPVPTPLSSTWACDGFAWTQECAQASPSERYSHAMAYDSAQGQVVVFGGNRSGTFLGDTWTWSGGASPVVCPTISGAVSASAFGGFSTAAPGSWVEIYGSNLAPSTRPWATSDFNGNKAPTSLDGVSVSIGGQAAFVDYISPTQVNAQLPSNISTTGDPLQQVTLTEGSTISDPFSMNVYYTQPGLLAPPSFKIGANQYVVAVLPDGTYVLPTRSIAGLDSRPAKPGETIVMYGIGFGPLTPDLPAGQIVTQANQITQPVQMMFGKTLAQLQYYGLAPGSVGLYQFNVTVPAVPDSNLVPLTFIVGGNFGTQTLFTAVHQ
jgi:uncharacterized protein (TIGR03437 family)